MKVTQPDIDSILAVLEITPSRIKVDSLGVEVAYFSLKQDKKSWSPHEILTHLRACADVWGGSIESMLVENWPVLPEIHPRKWQKQTTYPELDFHASLLAFSRQRSQLLKILTKLSFEEWSRGATIGGRIHTVFSQARRMAKHETEHCDQIERLLKGNG